MTLVFPTAYFDLYDGLFYNTTFYKLSSIRFFYQDKHLVNQTMYQEKHYIIINSLSYS